MKKLLSICCWLISWQILFAQKPTTTQIKNASFCTVLRQLEKNAATNFKTINENTEDKKELHFYSDHPIKNYIEKFYTTSLKLEGFEHWYISGGDLDYSQSWSVVPPDTYAAVLSIRYPAEKGNGVALKKMDGIKAKIAACLPGYSVKKEVTEWNEYNAFLFYYISYTFTKKIKDGSGSPEFKLILKRSEGDKINDHNVIVFSVTGTDTVNQKNRDTFFNSIFEREITKEDITQYPSINSDKITVAGISLGMKKEDVKKLIEKRNWGYEEKYDPVSSETRFTVNDKLSLLGSGPTDLFRLEWNITDDKLKAITFYPDFKDYVKGETKKLFSSETADPFSGFIKFFLGTEYRINTSTTGLTEQTEYDYYTNGFKISVSQYRNNEPTVTFCIYKQ